MPTGDPHRPARLRDEAVDHRQSEPGAAAGALGCEERLGRALQRDLVHALAGIALGDANVLARLQPRNIAGRDPLAMRRYRQTSAERHRVSSIEREVEQSQFELVRVELAL